MAGYRLEFLATHLLATAVEEYQRVHSIFHSGTYDRYPMEDDWGKALVPRQKLKGKNGSDGVHQDELGRPRVQAG